MGDLAVATVVGRLTRDAELKYTNSGQAICSFSVATNSRVKKGDQWVDEPNYWDIDLWGKKAESVNQYLTKGKLVAVSGDMRQDKWEKDGQQRMKVRINANDVQLIGGGQGSGEGKQSWNGPGGDSRPTGMDGRGSGRSDSDSRSEGGQAAQRQGNQGREQPRKPDVSPPPDNFTDDIPF